jgi:amino acid adenylation domain-containing protein
MTGSAPARRPEFHISEGAWPGLQARGVHQLFEAQAARSPDCPALLLEERSLTYRELDRQANRLAHLLRDRGIGPESVVGVCLGRSPAMLIALLATWKAGGAYVPLDPAYPEDRLSYMLRDSRASLLLTEERIARGMPSRETPLLRVDRDVPPNGPEHAPNLETHPEQLAYVLYTSGSTGRPKGVEVPQRALVNLLSSMRLQPGLSASDVLLAVTSISFDIAALELYLPLAVGARVFLAGDETASSGARLRESLARVAPTVMQATPASWRMLIDAGWEGSPGLRILCGGEALPPDLARDLLERGGEVWNLYGPTETTVWSTLKRIRRDRPVTIGQPIANTTVEILELDAPEGETGSTGEIAIGGAGVARGYRSRPDLTAERFVPSAVGGPGARTYRTGDLARRNADGELECLGRLDAQVKIRGFRVEPGEIEATLRRHPGVRDSAVVARAGDGGEMVLVAYVVGRGGKTPEVADLRQHLRMHLPEWMLPGLFVPLRSLPLTPNAKVDRKALPSPDAFRAGRARLAPRDSLEATLASIWERVLQVSEVGVQDDFFELGGHSIVAGRMFQQIERTLRVRGSPAMLLQAPTVELLANALRRRVTWEPERSLVPIQASGSRPPLFCMHAGAGTVLFYYELSRLLGEDQPVYGLQARGLYGGVPPHRTVEEMASHYVSEIRSVQPHGPYRLAGFCFGAVLAFEMAQQLRANGQQVAFLCSFDGPAPGHPDAHPEPAAPGGADAWLERHSRAFSALPPGRRFSYLAGRLRGRWRYTKARLQESSAHRMGELLSRLRWPLPANLRHYYFLVHNRRAEMAYRPRPYPGSMTVFEIEGGLQDPQLGWGPLVGGGVQVFPISGSQRGHRDILRGAFLRDLSRRLRSCLSATEAA